MLTIRLRIEYQGYESRQLSSLLGKMDSMPGMSGRVDYIMMRMPKLCDVDLSMEESK